MKKIVVAFDDWHPAMKRYKAVMRQVEGKAQMITEDGDILEYHMDNPHGGVGATIDSITE